MSAIIRARKLSKHFTYVDQSEKGWIASVQRLISPKWKVQKAVNELSFDIQKGERAALIGLNGAGKSTTIKMLTGILHPTSGQIEVLDLIPWKERESLSYQIGTIFGQRSQLWVHLPPLDSFQLLAKIYELEPKAYEKRCKELISLFHLEDFLHKPVRQLSLGERMRCEIVASLLHNPKILFLDEPTIGLDIQAKLLIRNLLNQFSLQNQTTILLTSHDMNDIEQLCDRVIVLHKGSLLLDTSIQDLRKTLFHKKRFTLTTHSDEFSLRYSGIKMIKNAHPHYCFDLDISITPLEEILQKCLPFACIRDICVESPSLEEMIRDLYETNPH